MNKKELVGKIQDLFIVREYDGSYNLFGKYIIQPNDRGTYIVTFRGDSDTVLDFGTLRHAVTWCVFQKNNKYKEIKRIYELDALLGSLDVSIAQHKRLADKAKTRESRSIFLAKLDEEKRKKRQLLQEINYYAELSKYWQNKKFQENQGT